MFLQRFIALLAITSFSSALIERWTRTFFGTSFVERFFALSFQGLEKGYFWQLATYPFVPVTEGAGIGFGTLLQIGFPLLILWQIGQDLLESLGKRRFLMLFFGSSIITGAITALFSLTTPIPSSFGGAMAPSLTMLTLWCCFFKEANIFLFFLFPIKAEWIPKGILFFQMLTFLSSFNLEDLVFTSSSIALGYGYFSLRSRFDSFSEFASDLWDRLSETIKAWIRKKKNKKADIFDFKTGRAISEDDLFVEDMLDKISKNGEESLSFEERDRLDAISRKRKRRF